MSNTGASPLCAISVNDVSKRFRLYHERPSSLKESIVNRRRRRYDEFWALKHVSLSVERGVTYGLIGHNGSGKSTLLRLMAGIHRPNGGDVSINGRISALLELGAGFHPELSGRENIYLNGSILGLSRKEIRSALHEIVEFSGLEEFIDTPVKVYSSGMYVRLGFSVAVNLDPEILIIDEIIAVGDEEFQRRCLDHLYKLRRQGVTIVVVSHTLSLIETLCDRVAWLDHGELKAEGSARDVTKQYLRMVNEAEESRLEENPADNAEMAGYARRGSREIEITSVEFRSGRDRAGPTGSTGDPLTVRMYFNATEVVDKPVFGIAFHHESGVHIAGPNTRIARLDTGAVVGEGYVEYRLERLVLMPGSYLVTACIFDTDILHAYDFRDRAFSLHVQPGSSAEQYGMVELPGVWQGPVLDASLEARA